MLLSAQFLHVARPRLTSSWAAAWCCQVRGTAGDGLTFTTRQNITINNSNTCSPLYLHLSCKSILVPTPRLLPANQTRLLLAPRDDASRFCMHWINLIILKLTYAVLSWTVHVVCTLLYKHSNETTAITRRIMKWPDGLINALNHKAHVVKLFLFFLTHKNEVIIYPQKGFAALMAAPVHH